MSNSIPNTSMSESSLSSPPLPLDMRWSGLVRPRELTELMEVSLAEEEEEASVIAVR